MTKLNLPETLVVNNVLCKKVPDFPNCYATEEGDIYLMNFEGKLLPTVKVKWRSTKGQYLYANVLDNRLTYSKKPIHRLICLAFHGKPNKTNVEPNHIDGDKLNNRPNNLEWLTRSENVQAAFDSGLCQQGLRIKAINIETNETLFYNSLTKMSKDWGIDRHKLREIFRVYKDRPFNNWIFEVDDSSDKLLGRHQVVNIKVMDYVLNVISIYDNITDASIATGVKSGTIVRRMRLEKDNPKLLSRYVFKRINDETTWPVYSVDEAKKAEELYNTPRKNSREIISSIELGKGFL